MHKKPLAKLAEFFQIKRLFLPTCAVFEEKEKTKKKGVLGKNKTSLWA